MRSKFLKEGKGIGRSAEVDAGPASGRRGNRVLRILDVYHLVFSDHTRMDGVQHGEDLHGI